MQKTILVVEDESLVLLDIADTFRGAGFRVIEASNGEQAMEVINATPGVDCLLTDVDMPGTIDGIALANSTSAQHPDVAIIIYSGRQLTADAIPPGASFLLKPCDPDALVELVEEKLERSHVSQLSPGIR